MKKLIHLAFFAYVLIDAFYLRDLLFSATLPITRELQANYGTPAFIKFNKFMAGLLNPDLCALLNVFYFCVTPNKYRAFKQMLFQCVSLYVLIFYKIIMGDPRPYFVDSAIKGWECYADFGNPSGHATSIWMFYGIILTEIYRDLHIRLEKKWQRDITKWIGITVFAFLQVGIVFCRIFLGVHSLNQVMIGTVFGIYIYFIYVYYTDDMMELLFNYIKNQSISLIKKFTLISVAFVVCIQIPVILYEIFKHDVPQLWRDNIYQSCPHFEDHQMFYKVCFKGCSTIAIFFGIIYSLLTNKEVNQIMLTQFKCEHYQRSYKVLELKNFAKSLICKAIFIGCFVLFYVVAPLHKFIEIDQVYSKYYSLGTGSFVGIFLLCSVLPYLYSSKPAEKSSAKNAEESTPLVKGTKKKN